MPTPQLLLCVLLLMPALLWSKEPLTVYYRAPEAEVDTRQSFEHDLLELLLEQTRRSHGPYRLLPYPPMNTARSLQVIANHSQPNLVIKYSYSDALRDNPNIHVLLPPVEFGAVGYRVCFASSKGQAKLANVRRLKDLGQLLIGQGIGWLDTQILRANGLQVVEVSNYLSLFRMVASNRIDLFCRGINEWQAELTSHRDIHGLLLDPSLLLHYPLPRVLLTHNADRELIERLEAGLQQVLANGELAHLWHHYYSASVEASNLTKRRAIELQNPFLTHFPERYKTLLLKPEQLLRLTQNPDSHCPTPTRDCSP